MTGKASHAEFIPGGNRLALSGGFGQKRGEYFPALHQAGRRAGFCWNICLKGDGYAAVLHVVLHLIDGFVQKFQRGLNVFGIISRAQADINLGDIFSENFGHIHFIDLASQP